MKSKFSLDRPIDFTKTELEQAHKGNYRPIDKRLRRELVMRARLFEVASKPHTEAELKELIRESTKPQSRIPRTSS